MDLAQIWNNLLAANIMHLNMEGVCTYPTNYLMQRLHVYANLTEAKLLNSPTPTNTSFVSSMHSDVSEATMSEDSQDETEEESKPDENMLKNLSQFCDNESKAKCRRRIQRTRYSREEYKCNSCTYTCTTEKAFFKHLTQECELSTNKDGEPKLSCPICGKDRDSETLILAHMAKHRFGKHFCCDLCKFRTLQMKKLIQHRRMHTGEKPHLCPFCTYRSARRDNLRSHVRRVHKKDNLTCDTFAPRSMLLRPNSVINSVDDALLNS